MKEELEAEFEGGSSPEDREFFDKLVEQYDIEQDREWLIIPRKDGSRTLIQKMRRIPSQDSSKGIAIEDYIKQVLAEVE